MNTKLIQGVLAVEQVALSKHNKKVKHPDGELKSEWCKGITSDLIGRLHKKGYTSAQCPKTCYISLVSPDGQVLIRDVKPWPAYLVKVAEYFENHNE